MLDTDEIWIEVVSAERENGTWGIFAELGGHWRGYVHFYVDPLDPSTYYFKVEEFSCPELDQYLDTYQLITPEQYLTVSEGMIASQLNSDSPGMEKDEIRLLEKMNTFVRENLTTAVQEPYHVLSESDFVTDESPSFAHYTPIDYVVWNEAVWNVEDVVSNGTVVLLHPTEIHVQIVGLEELEETVEVIQMHYDGRISTRGGR